MLVDTWFVVFNHSYNSKIKNLAYLDFIIMLEKYTTIHYQ